MDKKYKNDKSLGLTQNELDAHYKKFLQKVRENKKKYISKNSYNCTPVFSSKIIDFIVRKVT